MRYFKDKNSVVYAVDVGQEHLIQQDWKEISEKEATTPTPPTPEQTKLGRIEALKDQLRSTDYKVLPDYDKPNEDIKRQRQAWRDEIRALGG